MRATPAFAAFAFTLVTAGPAVADTPESQAGDRAAEALFQVQSDGIVEEGIIRGGFGPLMIANPGNANAFVVGCQNNCSGMHVTLRAAGLPDLTAGPNPGQPRSVILRIPAQYTRALSNFEVTMAASCLGTTACVQHWALLSQGAAPALEQRGLPRQVSDADWAAAQAPSPGSALHWQTLPSSEDMQFYYPVQAWRSGTPGRARLQCLLADGGALRCRQADATSPEFGAAALKLSTLLRLADTDASGQSLRNRQIIVPLRFQPG